MVVEVFVGAAPAGAAPDVVVKGREELEQGPQRGGVNERRRRKRRSARRRRRRRGLFAFVAVAAAAAVGPPPPAAALSLAPHGGAYRVVGDHEPEQPGGGALPGGVREILTVLVAPRARKGRAPGLSSGPSARELPGGRERRGAPHGVAKGPGTPALGVGERGRGESRGAEGRELVERDEAVAVAGWLFFLW